MPQRPSLDEHCHCSLSAASMLPHRPTPNHLSASTYDRPRSLGVADAHRSHRAFSDRFSQQIARIMQKTCRQRASITTIYLIENSVGYKNVMTLSVQNPVTFEFLTLNAHAFAENKALNCVTSRTIDTFPAGNLTLSIHPIFTPFPDLFAVAQAKPESPSLMPTLQPLLSAFSLSALVSEPSRLWRRPQHRECPDSWWSAKCQKPWEEASAENQVLHGEATRAASPHTLPPARLGIHLLTGFAALPDPRLRSSMPRNPSYKIRGFGAAV